MARDALGKLEDAKRIRKMAKDLQLANPGAARKLRDVAAKKESMAVRQFATRPRKRRAS